MILIISRKLQQSGNEMQLRRSLWRIRPCVMVITWLITFFTATCHLCDTLTANTDITRYICLISYESYLMSVESI